MYANLPFFSTTTGGVTTSNFFFEVIQYSVTVLVSASVMDTTESEKIAGFKPPSKRKWRASAPDSQWVCVEGVWIEQYGSNF